MNRWNIIRPALASMLALMPTMTTACGGSSDFDTSSLRGDQASGLDPSAGAKRVYFDVTNHVPVNGETLASFELVSGAVVELEAVTNDGSRMRYELWRKRPEGSMELVNAFDVESGFTLTTVNAKNDGTFFLRFPAPQSEREVVVHMTCKRDGAPCTSVLEPGEACDASRACDQGLVCDPPFGACDAWHVGTCRVPIDERACDDQAVASSVCGCDGQSYLSSCLAFANGTGVKAQGLCPIQ